MNARVASVTVSIASALAGVGCGEIIGSSCTAMACRSGVDVRLPEGYAESTDDVRAFCERVSGSVRVGDDVWTFGPGELPDLYEQMEGAKLYCGPTAELGGGGPLDIVLGNRLRVPIGMELIDVDGVRLEYAYGTPDYVRTGEVGGDCGPPCDYAHVTLTLAE